MPAKVLVNQTPYEESKTIDLGSVTDFTIDLSQAQRFVATMTGDGTLTLTEPVLMVDQEITLLVKCTAPRTLTLPANSYCASGPLTSYTFLPSGIVGTGGHALEGVTTANGIYWEDETASTGVLLRVPIHDVAGAGLAKGTIVYLDGGMTGTTWDARAYTPVGATTFPLGVVEIAIAAGGNNGYAIRRGVLSGLPLSGLAAGNLVTCYAAGAYGPSGAEPATSADIFPGIVGRCTAAAATATIAFDFMSFPSHIHGTAGLRDDAVTDAKIASQIVKDIGRCATGYVRFAGAGEAGGTALTIDATAYALAVGGGTAACAAELAGLINAGTQAKAIVDTTGNTVLIQWLTAGVAGNVALTTTFVAAFISGGGGIAGAAGAMSGGAAEAVKPLARGVYALQVGDAASLVAGAEIDIGGGSFATAPTTAILNVRTAAGIHKSPATTGSRIVNTAGTLYSVFISDAVGVLADTDVVSFILF